MGESQNPVRDAILTLAITAAAVALQYLAFDQGAKIEIKARWRALQSRLGAFPGAGLQEWWIAQRAGEVYEEAERITREAAG